MPGAAPSVDDIRDIKGLFSLYGWFQPGVLLGIILVLAVLALLYFRFRRKRAAAPPPPPEPPKPPGRLALEALADLERRLGESNPKPIYFALSEILRSYLESRFDIPATDRTSEEIQGLLRNVSQPGDSEKAIALQILKDTDVVKFTDFVPPVDARTETWRRTRDFVKALEPEPEGAA